MNVCADMDGWMRTQWSLSVWWGRSSGGTLLPRWNADYKNKPQNKQKLCCFTCQDCSILFKFAMKSLSNFDVRLSLHPLQSHNNFCCFGVSFFNCPLSITYKSCQVFPTDMLVDVSRGGSGKMGVGRCGATCG